jgi:hypothetical protein
MHGSRTEDVERVPPSSPHGRRQHVTAVRRAPVPAFDHTLRLGCGALRRPVRERKRFITPPGADAEVFCAAPASLDRTSTGAAGGVNGNGGAALLTLYCGLFLPWRCHRLRPRQPVLVDAGSVNGLISRCSALCRLSPCPTHPAASPPLGTPTRYPAAMSSVTPVDNRSPTSTAARPRPRRGKRTCSRRTKRGASRRTSRGYRSC